MLKKKFVLLVVIIFGLIFISACNTSDTGSATDNENEGLVAESVEFRVDEIDEQPDESEDQPEGQSEDQPADEPEDQPEIMLENEAFRIYEPAPNSEVETEFTVRGQARVSDANVRYEFEDGHYLFDEGIATVSDGGSEWGDFEITFQFEEWFSGHAVVFLFEEGAEDGSRLHQLEIPIYHEGDQSIDRGAEAEVVLENEAFKIYEPVPSSVVENEFIVRGQARVFEGNVRYEFEDGHNILDEGFVTASEGAPEWGDFEITIQFDELWHEDGMVILFEESAKDGERLHELIIPVKYHK